MKGQKDIKNKAEQCIKSSIEANSVEPYQIYSNINFGMYIVGYTVGTLVLQ